MIAQLTDTTQPGIGVLVTYLPGPSRKRDRAPYRYRITYRSPDLSDTGCVMTWCVEGGRETYQIALERYPSGDLHWHCTCADAVYRSELRDGHRCKHVQGLIDCSPPTDAEPDVRRSA